MITKFDNFKKYYFVNILKTNEIEREYKKIEELNIKNYFYIYSNESLVGIIYTTEYIKNKYFHNWLYENDDIIHRIEIEDKSRGFENVKVDPMIWLQSKKYNL